MRKGRAAEPTSFQSSDPRWELAVRIANGSNLRNCFKLRAFLLYVCENEILGQPENIREQLIGNRVFGRPTDYNISDDNIVRVEARELRKRLETYFGAEGREETIILEIPKGGYVPVFRPREEAPAAAELEAPANDDLPPALPWWRRASVLFAIFSTLCLASSIALFGLRQQIPRLSAANAEYAIYPDLLKSLTEKGSREIVIVLSNPKVVLYYGRQNASPGVNGQGLTVPAPPELKKSFGAALNNIDQVSAHQFLHVTRDDYTGMGEAVAAFHLGRLLLAMQLPVRLMQGRFLSWDQVQKQNLAVLGAPMINDWTYHNVGRSNFSLEKDGVVNVNPLPGEQKFYANQREATAEPGSALTAYGIVEMATSRYGYNMLLVAGTTSAGTGGAGDFFTNPDKMRVAWERIRSAAPGKPFPINWEVLLRVDVRDGLPVNTALLAVRPARSGS